MPTLAGPLSFDAPPSGFLESIPHLTKTLLWYGLAPETRRGYNTAIRSYEFFCTSQGKSPWPATTHSLIGWVNTRAFGSAIPNQGQIQADTIAGYLSGLRSYHVDRNFSTTVFESFQLDRVPRGVRRMFPQTKKTPLPITKDILLNITRIKPTSLQGLIIYAAFKVAWAGFLRMGEFTYTKADLENRKVFSATNLTRSGITFSQDDQYVVLGLERSKTDVKHTGVEPIIAATKTRLAQYQPSVNSLCLTPNKVMLHYLDWTVEPPLHVNPLSKSFAKNSKQAVFHARRIPAIVFARVQLNMLLIIAC